MTFSSAGKAHGANYRHNTTLFRAWRTCHRNFSCFIPEITRSAQNAVAPAKAGAYDVCMGRPTDEIGPSLRWGDGCCATSISSASTKGIAPTATSSPQLGDRCINPKIDIHWNFVNPLLSHVFSSHLIGGLRIMLRSNAKAVAKQSYFGDDAPVTVIPRG
jgi:hypothetical protein